MRKHISFLMLGIFSLIIMLLSANTARGQILDETLVINVPDICREQVMVSLQIPDARTVTKVEFYMNYIYQYTDFAKDYKWKWNTSDLPNREYRIRAVVYSPPSPFGESIYYNEKVVTVDNPKPDLTPPVINFSMPANEATVFGMDVDIKVTATESDSNIDYIEYYVDGEYLWTDDEEPGVRKDSNYKWNSYGVSGDEWHTITAKAYNSSGTSASSSVNVYVENPAATVSYYDLLDTPVYKISPFCLTRPRVWWRYYPNYYEVSLKIKNFSSKKLYGIKVTDIHYGFQAFPSDQGYKTDIYYNPDTKSSEVTFSIWNLEPGMTKTVTCNVVPILFEPDPRISFMIGKKTIIKYLTNFPVYYCYGSLQGPFNCDLPYKTEERFVPAAETYFDFMGPTLIRPINSNTVLGQLGLANYLIVTNPRNLYSLYDDDEVSTLLSELAHFCLDKNAVLGYLDIGGGDAAAHLKNAISPYYMYNLNTNKITKGGWNHYLDPNWSTEGYLLIVGEKEIVPAVTSFIPNISCKDNIPQEVPLNDNFYSDITGNYSPDVAVGRIIGNDAERLITPIRVSLGVRNQTPGFHYDASDALLVSGYGNYQGSFIDAVNTIGPILSAKNTTPEIIHWTDYSTGPQMNQAFLSKVPGKDIIFWSGHGGPGSWSEGLKTTTMPSDFGGVNPVVFATSCHTGNYEGNGDYSIAEAFLERGAGVYIGGTRMTNSGTNYTLGTSFFGQYWSKTSSIGRSFLNIEKDLWALAGIPSSDPDACPELWYREISAYNLYGDPTYYPVQTALKSTSAPDYSGPSDSVETREATPPPTTLGLELPDYTHTTVDGFDYFDIPGGYILLADNQYRVPFYLESIEIAQGYTIQNVTLTNRQGLITERGINLPLVETGDMEEEPEGSATSSAEWFPTEDYNWIVQENADGSSTLKIIIYPFYYNQYTTGIKYYTEYEFGINSLESSVELSDVTIADQEIGLDETVGIEVVFNNSNTRIDTVSVALAAQIETYLGSQIIDEIETQSLALPQGKSSTTMYFETSDLTAGGDYVVKVLLYDATGGVLDSKTISFKVGNKDGEITDISATPHIYNPGDEITICMAFANTGDLEINNGNAIIMVKDPNEKIMAEFTHNFSALAPTAVVTFDDVWMTTSTCKGTYFINGYVTYNGQCEISPQITVTDQDAPPETYEMTIPMELPAGWSFISLPVAPVALENFTLEGLFPEAEAAYKFTDKEYEGLRPNEEFEIGEGYWIYMPEPQTYSITGLTILNYKIPEPTAGWAMIGGCSFEARPAEDVCEIGVIYRYVNGIGYQRVLESELMRPGEGYWILLEEVSNECQLKIEAVSF